MMSSEGGRASSLPIRTGESSDCTLNVASGSGGGDFARSAGESVNKSGCGVGDLAGVEGAAGEAAGIAGEIGDGDDECGAVGDAGGGGSVGTAVAAPAGFTVLVDDDSCTVWDFDGGTGVSISRIIMSPPASRSV